VELLSGSGKKVSFPHGGDRHSVVPARVQQGLAEEVTLGRVNQRVGLQRDAQIAPGPAGTKEKAAARHVISIPCQMVDFRGEYSNRDRLRDRQAALEEGFGFLEVQF